MVDAQHEAAHAGQATKFFSVREKASTDKMINGTSILATMSLFVKPARVPPRVAFEW
jgi:hypothetical protein